MMKVSARRTCLDYYVLYLKGEFPDSFISAESVDPLDASVSPERQKRVPPGAENSLALFENG